MPHIIRRFIKTLAALSLAIVLILTNQTSPAAWNEFVRTSDHWLRSAISLFANGHFSPVVSAQAVQDDLNNWQNWPSSKKHKQFVNGTWFLPFEAFQQQYYRGWQVKSKPAHYIDGPMNIDLNGDGLQDLLYSKGSIAYINGIFKWVGLQQHIILKRANGFELAYKCRQEPKTIYGQQITTEYFYYGDCADTNYVSGSDPAYETMWNPAGIWYQQTAQWRNSNVLGNQANQQYLGFGNTGYDYLNVDMNINSSYVETFDRYMPKFTDLNGDGLVDVAFFGMNHVGDTMDAPYTYLSTNFVLYNTGHGFEIEAACVQQYLAWTSNNKPVPRGVPFSGNGYYCY